jgi:NAD(P)-dependent dehydrogenase (short-subunit alcohol dehydrogenase family)
MLPPLAPGLTGSRPTCRGAIVTGGDSGIVQAVAHASAQEGTDVAIPYLGEEAEDAVRTRACVERRSRYFLTGRCALAASCYGAAGRSVAAFGRFDVLVSNAGRSGLPGRFRRAFETDVNGCFRTPQAALPRTGGGRVDHRHRIDHGHPRPSRPA